MRQISQLFLHSFLRPQGLSTWRAMLLLGVALTMTGNLLPTVAAQPPAKNVLLLVADDLGRDLGCYGGTNIVTPHLDQLAKQGTRFNQAFATVASCSPSRSVMLTGLHVHTSGQYGLAHATHNFHTMRSVQPLPARLRAAGYATAVLGKLHVQPEQHYGFDKVLAAPGGGRDVA